MTTVASISIKNSGNTNPVTLIILWAGDGISANYFTVAVPMISYTFGII